MGRIGLSLRNRHHAERANHVRLTLKAQQDGIVAGSAVFKPNCGRGMG